MEPKYYLYGTVRTTEATSLGPVSLTTTGKAEEVKVFVSEGLGIAYTEKDRDEEEITATRKNLVNHQKIVERLMDRYGVVIPFAFGTLMDSKEEMEQLLKERQANFEEILQRIDGRVELTLKMMWEKMEPVFAEIVDEDEEIKEKRLSLTASSSQVQNEQIELGKLVEAALLNKKEQLCQQIIAPLLEIAEDHRIQKNITESMFVNVNFLVKKEDESKFDEAINAIGDAFEQNTLIKYIGPAAPVNFL